MKQNTFMSTLALVAIAFLTACGSDELPADPSFDQDIKTELVDKSQLPEWLADYVSYLDRNFPQRSLVSIALSGMVRPIMNCIILHKVHFMRKCILPMAYHID